MTRPTQRPAPGESRLPKCAVLTCTNDADPRWYAKDTGGRHVMICDGHELTPASTEVRPAHDDDRRVTWYDSGRGVRVAIRRHNEEWMIDAGVARRLRDELTEVLEQIDATTTPTIAPPVEDAQDGER